MTLLLNGQHQPPNRMYLVDEYNLARRVTPSHSLVRYQGIQSDRLKSGNVLLVRSTVGPIEPIQSISGISVGNEEQSGYIRESLEG